MTTQEPTNTPAQQPNPTTNTPPAQKVDPSKQPNDPMNKDKFGKPDEKKDGTACSTDKKSCDTK